jgi:hypothetical protein
MQDPEQMVYASPEEAGGKWMIEGFYNSDLDRDPPGHQVFFQNGEDEYVEPGQAHLLPELYD